MTQHLLGQFHIESAVDAMGMVGVRAECKWGTTPAPDADGISMPSPKKRLGMKNG